MSTPSITEFDRWDEVKRTQEDLFTSVMRGNEALREKISSLKDEVELLKSGRKDLKAEVEALRRQETYLSQQLIELKGYTPIIYCLLDGDGCQFIPELIRRGEAGGHEAAAALEQSIRENVDRDRNTKICVFIYLNLIGLRDHLVRDDICGPNDFHAFMNGFSQSTELFHVVDVGRGKEAADAKLRDMLNLVTPIPQVSKVIFGGGHDNGYATVLHSLETRGLANKLVILDYNNNASSINAMNFTRISMPTLFWDSDRLFKKTIKHSTFNLERRPSIPSSDGSWTTVSTSTTSALSSPRTAASVVKGPTKTATPSPHSPISAKPKDVTASKPVPLKINQYKSMIKQDPRICNSHYLSKCYKDDCPHSHEYELTEQQTAKLVKELKSIPCKGNGCPGPEICWLGH